MFGEFCDWYRKSLLCQGIIKCSRQSAGIDIARHPALHTLQFLQAIFLCELVGVIGIDERTFLISSAHKVLQLCLLFATSIRNGALHLLFLIGGITLGIDIVDAQEVCCQVKNLLGVGVGRDKRQGAFFVLGILLDLGYHLVTILIEHVIEHHFHISLRLVGKVLAIAGFHAEVILHAIQHESLRCLHQSQLFQSRNNLCLLAIDLYLILAHVVDDLLLYLAGDAILFGCL